MPSTGPEPIYRPHQLATRRKVARAEASYEWVGKFLSLVVVIVLAVAAMHVLPSISARVAKSIVPSTAPASPLPTKAAR